MIARGKLKVCGFCPAALTTMGVFSIRVMKLACWGRISKGPCRFLELMDSASVSNNSCWGEMIRRWKVGLGTISNLSDLSNLSHLIIPPSFNDPIYINLSLEMLSNFPDSITSISFTDVSRETKAPFLPVCFSVMKNGCVR